MEQNTKYESGITGLQVAQSISQRLADDVLACSINGEVCDLTTRTLALEKE